MQNYSIEFQVRIFQRFISREVEVSLLAHPLIYLYTPFLSSQPQSLINASFQTHMHLLEHAETQLQMGCLYSLDRHLLANKPTISSHCPFIIVCIKKKQQLNHLVKTFATYSHTVLYPVQNAWVMLCLFSRWLRSKHFFNKSKINLYG